MKNNQYLIGMVTMLFLGACGTSVPIVDGDNHLSQSAPGGPGQVLSQQGWLLGQDLGTSTVFRGVPYAQPPIGPLRWKAPVPPSTWTGVRAATQFADTCIQVSTANKLIGGAEDCLYLDVWMPKGASGTLPVLVWIHGGFFMTGAGSLPLYDGQYLAEHGPAVVVTLNYRLSAMGFVNHPALDAESPTGSSGNYGLLDQIRALQWVQNNIAAFGGDPAHVTIFGASAGGGSVAALFTSPLAGGLFSGAIVESGGVFHGTVDPSDGQGTLDTIAKNLGCAAGDLNCLRAQPANAIATAFPTDYTVPGSHRWNIFVDGHVVPVMPLQSVRSGAQLPVALMVGTTSNEFSTLFSHYFANPILTDADYQTAIHSLYSASIVPQIIATYPSASLSSPQEALIQVMSDQSMVCSTRRFARAAVKTGTKPVWRYLYNHSDESGPQVGLGAGHYMDVPFQFHNFAAAGFTPSVDESALSDAIIASYTRFALTGNPNAQGSSAWPAYDSNLDATEVLDTTWASQDGIHAALCDFWDSLP